MTETHESLSTTTSIPVLAYESPTDHSIDLARLRCWILRGGVISGVCGAVIFPLSALSSWLTPRSAMTVSEAWLSWILVLTSAALAATCLACLRRKLSESRMRLVAGALLHAFFGASVLGTCFLYEELHRRKIISAVSINVGLNHFCGLVVSIFWPALVVYMLNPTAADLRPALRRALYRMNGALLLCLALPGAGVFLYFPGLRLAYLMLPYFGTLILQSLICLALAPLCFIAARKSESRTRTMVMLIGVAIGVLAGSWSNQEAVNRLLKSNLYWAAGASIAATVAYQIRAWSPMIVLVLWSLSVRPERTVRMND